MNPTFVSRFFVSLAILNIVGFVFAAPSGTGEEAWPFDEPPAHYPKDADLPPGAKDGCWPVVYKTTRTLQSGVTTTVLATATACV